MTYRAPDTRDSERRRRQVFAAFWSIAVILVLAVFRAVLVPFIMAALLAFVLSPIVRRVTKISFGGRFLPRWVVIVAVYVTIVASLVLTIRFTAPVIVAETRDFIRDEVPRLRREFKDNWMPRLRAVTRLVAPAPAQTPAAPGESTAMPLGPEWGTTDHTVHIDPQPSGGYRVILPTEGVTIERQGENRLRVLPSRPVDHRGDGERLMDQARALSAGHTGDLLRLGRGIVGSLVGGVFGFFITLMLSAYMLLTEESIFAFIASLVPPPARAAYWELLARIDRGLAGVVRGQLLICLVNGVLSAIGFGIANVPYWPLLALIAMVFSIVPIFGSILSSIPVVAIALSQGVGKAVFVLLWIIGIHQVEANLLNPKIMGDAAKLNPLLVVFSLLAGEHFFGILGALLAVPTMSIAQSVFLHWRKYAMSYGDARIARDSLTPPPPSVSSAETSTPPVAIAPSEADVATSRSARDDE